jgi:hypothetical protein
MADFFTDWCQIFFRSGARHPVALLLPGGLLYIFRYLLQFGACGFKSDTALISYVRQLFKFDFISHFKTIDRIICFRLAGCLLGNHTLVWMHKIKSKNLSCDRIMAW